MLGCTVATPAKNTSSRITPQGIARQNAAPWRGFQLKKTRLQSAAV
jgi:hypothetical protein